jgi:hypothetical protein
MPNQPYVLPKRRRVHPGRKPTEDFYTKGPKGANNPKGSLRKLRKRFPKSFDRPT